MDGFRDLLERHLTIDELVRIARWRCLAHQREPRGGEEQRAVNRLLTHPSHCDRRDSDCHGRVVVAAGWLRALLEQGTLSEDEALGYLHCQLAESYPE